MATIVEENEEFKAVADVAKGAAIDEALEELGDNEQFGELPEGVQDAITGKLEDMKPPEEDEDGEAADAGDCNCIPREEMARSRLLQASHSSFFQPALTSGALL